jgi:hypothetical protein
MSQKESTELNANLSNLAHLARRAYDQKRVKECLDLTRAMLLIDPDNADAQWMRSSIQSEMQRDLDDARQFLRLAHSKESTQAPEPAEQPVVSTGVSMNSASSHSDAQRSSEAGNGDQDKELPARPVHTRWALRIGAVLVLGFVAGSLLRYALRSNPVEASPNASDRARQAVSSKEAPPPPTVSAPDAPATAADAEIPSVPLLPAPASEHTSESAEPRPVTPPAADSAARAAKLPLEPVVTAKGILAVSSPTSVDIYKDDAYIGSAPVSIELPAGAYTLEYRHGALRRFMTHVVNGNETTKAMVTFDVSVQINSKPWAEVFVDGTERKALGQTPLSGVRVPIGGVLVFENPQFQTKRYRVTGNETGIQIVFP